MANQLTPFAWGEIALSQTAYVNGVPHATREAIGEWLEYAEPRKAISTLLERNSFIEEHSVVLNLRTTDGKNYDIKVYHPIGFLLMCMKAETDKARQMQEAVARFVWHFAGPKSFTPKERMERMKHRRTLLLDLAKTGDLTIRGALIEDLRDVSLELGVAMPGFATPQPSLPGV